MPVLPRQVGPTESPDSAQVNVSEEIKEHIAEQVAEKYSAYTKTPSFFKGTPASVPYFYGSHK